MVQQEEVPPSHMEHPVAISSGFTAVPVALYFDAVPYTKNDGVLGIWVVNITTGRRHLIACLRKSKMCRCGCKSWCSLYEVLRFVHWSLKAMAAGEHPPARHDGCQYGEDELQRNALAGAPLAHRFAVIMIKGDWAEFAHTLGLTTWGSATCPCPFCHATKAQWFSMDGFSPMHFPHELMTHAQYDEACSSAEIKVDIDAILHSRIKAALYYDKRQDGARGRALKHDIVSAGLCKGDRLEPSCELPDVNAFEDITLPCRVTFWRRDRTTRVHHRNPLFDDTIGITITTLMIDQLHTLNLGVMQQYCRELVWELILSDAWHVSAGRTEAEQIEISVSRLWSELIAWYSERRREFPSENLTQNQDLTVAMLGTKNKRSLKLKAAETKGMLLFLTGCLGKHAATLSRGDVWQSAGDALVGILNVLQTDSMRLPLPLVQDFDFWVAIMRAWRCARQVFFINVR